VDAVRRDVTVVTVPLLGADWYGEELARRYQLLPGHGKADAPRDRPLPAIIAERARDQGRPVTASIALDRHTRDQLGRDWVQSGLVYVQLPGAGADTVAARRVEVDTLATRNWAARVDQWLRGLDVPGSTDTMDDYAVGLLQCPRLSLVPNPTKAQSDSLASLCNHR